MRIFNLMDQKFNYRKIFIQNYQVYLKMHTNKNKDQSVSKVSILMDASNSKLILPTPNSSFFNCKTFCFYFPQFEEVIYDQLTNKRQREQTLQSFARAIINQANSPFKSKVEPDAPLIFKTFDRKEELITSTSRLYFNQCLRVKVIFQKKMQGIKFESKTLLQIKVASLCKYIVEVDAHKKLRLQELLILYKLDDYQFTSLMVNGQIVRHYQSLEKLSLGHGMHDGFPLFTFQTFYKDMSEIYNHMTNLGISFQTLVGEYGQNPQQNESLQLICRKLPAYALDKIVQMTIIYITSKHFLFQQHKKYLINYLNNKIGDLFSDKKSQMMSLMVNSIEQLPLEDDQSIIFTCQEIVDQLDFQNQFNQGQIFIIQTLLPATNSIQRLSLKPQKRYIVYEIGQKSAKYIGRYTYQHLGYTHIILPFKHYIIESKAIIAKNYHIRLYQIPIPKYTDHGLILWITNDFTEAKAFKKKQEESKQMKFQLILFKDITFYKIWIQKYVSLIASRKYCIIYNKDNIAEGIQTIQLAKKSLGKKANILIYVSSDQLAFKSYLDLSKVKVETQRRSVHNFISQCLQVNKDNVQSIRCQACSCLVS